jgi:hypothetical protein
MATFFVPGLEQCNFECFTSPKKTGLLKNQKSHFLPTHRKTNEQKKVTLPIKQK